MSETRPNRLIHENSPYLRQHAHNPVDWFPWCDEALHEARQQGRPVLLSIGYSACHWCHVMERESFEDPEIAALMNRLFVNIKVDREERPDLDSIYMSYVQATTGQGGWPLTVFLSPDGVPFYGGTYFPPTDRYGRPGFPTVLHSVSRFFHEQGHRIAESVPEIRRILTQALPDSGSRKADLSLLREGMDGALRLLDPRHGGFGSAPKFPGSMSLGALLRGWRRWGTASALDGVELSLTAMAEGGIYDHLGGGFHRYSVDERWLVPHFEKMLYDNALLVRLYLEAYQATGKRRYRETAEETLTYVRDCLTSPEGGFYSSEDADSEGEEGRFYVWTREEIERELGEDAAVFCDFYGVSTVGNWEGVNILHRRRELEALAREAGQAPADLELWIRRSREHLLSVRNRRVRPGLDTKVLASWNGLMVAACAEAGFVLGDGRWLEMARRAAEFLQRDLYADDRLWRCRGTAGRLLPAYIEDYAHVAEGLLCLYQASGEPAWLQWARDLVEQALDQFYDPEAGDFHFTAADHEALLVRPKDYFDNAIPSGNSTMAVNLILLHHLTGESRFRELAGRLLERAAEAMRRYPTGFGNWQRALGLYLGPTRAFVLVGEAPSRDELVEPLRRAYVPEKVVAMGVSGEALPLFEGREVSEGAAVWVCEDQVCLPSVGSPQEFAALLRQ